MHKPVLVEEILSALLNNSSGDKQRYIDATLGAGGHSRALLAAGVQVLGIDTDEKMLKIARKNLEGMPAAKLVIGNFRNIKEIAKENGFRQVNGILFDLGVSNYHFLSDKRGFSFQDRQAPLDMRLNSRVQKVTAADLLNSLSEDQLMKLFLASVEYGAAKTLVKKVLKTRSINKIKTVGDFLKLTKKYGKSKVHPATKPFLALRMAVNSELENLKEALPQAIELLADEGRLAVISFHSGEDKIVKDFFKMLAQKNEVRIITKRPVVPGDKEVEENAAARSAKLRIVEKI